MAFQWPVDKLGVINRALSQCGDNLVNAAEDGSDEWTTCSPAYEEGLGVLIEEHGWGFATKVNANLPPSPTAPANTAWDTAYPLPSDLIHLIWVKINYNTSDPTSNLIAQPTVYDIENGQLVLNAQGGPPPPSPPQTPAIVSIKYISADNADATAGTPLFVLALTRYVMSAVYRGLHGDPGEADKQFALADALAQRSRSRYDMQKPKRALFNSRITASRRVRKPWPPTPSGWSGSGIPG